MNDFPIFRLTIFLAAGIFFAETLQLNEITCPLLLAVGLLVVLGCMMRSSPYRNRWFFGVGIAGLMFLIGMVLTASAWKKVRAEWPSERKGYVGVVQETPEEKPRTMKCRIKLSDKEVLLYLPKDSLSHSLRMGEELMFHARILPPRSMDSLSAFDYARYLYHQGISGTAYVPVRYWKRTGRSVPLTWKQKALLFREKIIGRYRCWGIGEKQLPVLSALTLGYKGDLDKEIRTAYSQAGIAHVLALSGMHIGILWLMLDFLFKPLGVIRKMRWVKGVVVISVLWAFAFLVGMGASVVRAVFMCMLMSMAQWSGSKSFSMNTLAVAAFFMLLVRPFHLFDVGFQLSFVAVASILCFYGPLHRLLPGRNRLLQSGWGVMSVSLAAQLGTAPLVMYYFSIFSVYFLWTNLVVAVLVPLILYGSVLMCLLVPIPDLQGIVVYGLNRLIDTMNGLASWTSGLPYATFTFSELHPIEIVFFYTGLLVGLQYLHTRKRKWLIGCLAIVAGILGLHLLFIHFAK